MAETQNLKIKVEIADLDKFQVLIGALQAWADNLKGPLTPEEQDLFDAVISFGK